MIDEAYVKNLENAVEQYQEMIVSHSEKKSSFIAVDRDTLLGELPELVKNVNLCYKKVWARKCRKYWHAWRHRGVGKWYRFLFKKRMNVGFEKWFLDTKEEYDSKSDVFDKFRTTYDRLRPHNKYESGLKEIIIIARCYGNGISMVYLDLSDCHTIVCARNFVKNWKHVELIDLEGISKNGRE